MSCAKPCLAFVRLLSFGQHWVTFTWFECTGFKLDADVNSLDARIGVRNDAKIYTSGDQQAHSLCGVENFVLDTTSAWDQVPNVLAQVTRARELVTELQEHHKIGNSILDEIYAHQSHTQVALSVLMIHCHIPLFTISLYLTYTALTTVIKLRM